ncbi:hypothetical protein AX14_012700, partial [Amanita brunnescens Koide BX004]
HHLNTNSFPDSQLQTTPSHAPSLQLNRLSRQLECCLMQSHGFRARQRVTVFDVSFISFGLGVNVPSPLPHPNNDEIFSTIFCSAFANVRAASMLVLCVYTTKYLKQQSQLHYASTFASLFNSISNSLYLPSTPSAKDPGSSTDNNLRSQRRAIR